MAEENDGQQKKKEYFNALGVPSDDEVAYLNAIAGENMGLMRQYMKTRGKFYQNETGRLAMVILAIYNLYKKNDEVLYFDQELTAYVLPNKDWLLNDPLTYVKSTFEGYKDDRVISKIVRYIEYRWLTTKVTSTNVRTTISEYLLEQFSIDPFFVAVQKAYQKLLDNKHNWGPVTILDFYKALSNGITDDTAEPYRKRVFEYMLKAPLILRWQKADGRPAYTGGGIQAMPILYGKQGLGKSTLVNLLGLGWTNSIKNVAKEDQENIYKRAMNVYLDFGELSGMRKADLEDLKSALTQRFLTFNPKYSNGLKTLPSNALIVGTTNVSDLLKDLTGERRFWPIAIHSYDYKEVNERFILRAYATQYMELKLDFDKGETPSLNMIESEEDRFYKSENYGQADKSSIIVSNFITDLMNDKNYEGSSYFGLHADLVCFASKQKIEKAFILWCDEQREENGQNITVYPSKVTNTLLGLPNSQNTKIFKYQGKMVRGIGVPAVELAKLLGITL